MVQLIPGIIIIIIIRVSRRSDACLSSPSATAPSTDRFDVVKDSPRLAFSEWTYFDCVSASVGKVHFTTGLISPLLLSPTCLGINEGLGHGWYVANRPRLAASFDQIRSIVISHVVSRTQLALRHLSALAKLVLSLYDAVLSPSRFDHTIQLDCR